MGEFSRKGVAEQKVHSGNDFDGALNRLLGLLEKHPTFDTYFESKAKEEIRLHVFVNSKRFENYQNEIHKTFHFSHQGVDRILEFAPPTVDIELYKLDDQYGHMVLSRSFTRIVEQKNYFDYKSFSRLTRESNK